MALRWRIRHKLMLGLGLVVGIMALLLGGTLRGLWAYYLTTHSIRSKMAELKAAEDLKEVVARLTATHNLVYLVRHPTQVIRSPRPKEATNIDDVIKKLDEYEHQLQENLSQNPEPDQDPFEEETVKSLKKNLKDFEAGVVEVANQATVAGPSGESEPEAVLANRDDQVRGAVLFLFGNLAVPLGRAPAQVAVPVKLVVEAENPVRREAGKLTFNALDLRDRIYRQLDSHLVDARRHYQVTLWIVLPSSIVGLLLMAGLMRSFYAWVFYPIRDLETGVNRVARGDFDHSIDVHSGDEMEDLGAAFNDMMRRLHDLYCDMARQVNERSRQLVRSEQLASVGFLAAGVAHEINNPLASIAFCSEALESRLGELLRTLKTSGRPGGEHEVFRKYLKMIQEEAFRCKSITERLLTFSRTGERRREATDLGQLIQSVLDITQHLQNCRGKQIVFEKALRDDPQGRGKIVAPVNADEIKSVVLNLVVNALDSMEEGGKLTIQMVQKDGMAELRFNDTGCGMTQEVLDNIFEPFFTRSRTGKGTGLGLTISHRIISQHGGEIEATSAGASRGSTFVVRLPLHFEEPANPPPGEGRGTERPAGSGAARKAA